MNKNIKFIYFDVGGVTILDFSKTNKWQEMTQALGINKSNRKKFTSYNTAYLVTAFMQKPPLIFASATLRQTSDMPKRYVK